mgnify:CR=1 FL=1
MPKTSVNSPQFLLKYGQNNLNHARFAVVVSKKIDKKATGRNKIRRRVISLIKKIFEKELSFDFVFIVRKEIGQDMQTIEIDLKKVRAQIH